jgi:hypothetical protein
VLPARAWGVSDWFTGPDGKQVSYSTISQLTRSAVQRYFLRHQGTHRVSVTQVLRLLSRQGYTHWGSYQPESRFWHFQLIEGGWLLALALLFGAATIWLVRRRAA